MSYAAVTNEFAIYSEDFGLLGPRTITVQTYFVEYVAITSGPSEETVITIIDPCLDPFSLTMPTQSQPANYLYTLDSPSLSHNT